MRNFHITLFLSLKSETGNFLFFFPQNLMKITKTLISCRAEILLSRIKLGFPEIREAILAMDEEKIDEQMLIQFIESVPTPEETVVLNKVQRSEVDRLSAAEQFLFGVSLPLPSLSFPMKNIAYLDFLFFIFYFFGPPTITLFKPSRGQLHHIYRCGPRLECFLFKKRFRERVAELEPVKRKEKEKKRKERKKGRRSENYFPLFFSAPRQECIFDSAPLTCFANNAETGHTPVGLLLGQGRPEHPPNLLGASNRSSLDYLNSF
jgi:hypothetical protein